jgi:predicted transcriptional regulator
MARIHVNLDDDVLQKLDEVAGPRGRSAYLLAALAEKLDRERRWAVIFDAFGAIPEDGTHPWDGRDASEWVREERKRGSKKSWDLSS